MSPLPHRIRHRFPILEHTTYLNSCSQGALSDAVRQAYEEYLRGWDERGSPWSEWVGKAEQARALFAGLIGAGAEEIAVTTSLSAGLSGLATGLRFAGPRFKVVISDFEFPTVGQIWHAQEARGARVVHVPPAGDGTVPVERFADVIDEETLLVSITHVSYRTGAMLDVPAIAALAHERGALVLLDAYQTAGSVPLDVGELGVDFLAAGVLKYLLGSAGLAFLWCRRELVERVWPAATGWFADEDADAMDHTDYSPARTARRFESGTPPVPSIYAGIAGIELMQEVGIPETRAHVLGLHERLLAGLGELGATVVTPRAPAQRGALLCVRSTDAPALVAALAEERIVTSERDSCLRISPHCYNGSDDVDTLLAALARHRHLLA
jgi:selenocysteine lyase/cysteine desulfurase